MPASERVPPTSKSNVFQVGVTMLSAMMGTEYDLTRDEQGRRYKTNTKWEKVVEEGKWSDYSKDLIDLVEDCVRDEMEDRPSPQELLDMIEDYIPMYADGMDRWGTLSWVHEKSSEIDERLAAEDASHADADVVADAATGEKRKASGPPELFTDAKRVKAQTALERRLAYVASVIKGVRPRPECHGDDQDFILSRRKRLIYKNVDTMFDSDVFFDTADPGPIKYLELDPNAKYLAVIEIDDDDDDDNVDDEADEEEHDEEMYNEEEYSRVVKAESLPAPYTPAKHKKPLKGAGTAIDPFVLYSTPAKPTPAKPTTVKPTPSKPTPAKPTKVPPPVGSMKDNDLFSSHWE